MGNQQETDTAYVAGIVDGEGCIHVSLQTRRSNGTGTLHHLVQIANTSAKLVDFLVSWFTVNEIPFHVHWTKPSGKNQKMYAQVRVTRFVGIKKFLTAILPYMHIKNEQAKLMLEFTDARLAILQDTQGKRRPSYTERDLQIMQLMKELNQRGTGPSTTTRETLPSEDIVSSRRETYELR